jgi:hypothetical protein
MFLCYVLIKHIACGASLSMAACKFCINDHHPMRYNSNSFSRLVLMSIYRCKMYFACDLIYKIEGVINTLPLWGIAIAIDPNNLLYVLSWLTSCLPGSYFIIYKSISRRIHQKASGSMIWDAFQESDGQKEIENLNRKVIIFRRVPRTVSGCMHFNREINICGQSSWEKVWGRWAKEDDIWGWGAACIHVFHLSLFFVSSLSDPPRVCRISTADAGYKMRRFLPLEDVTGKPFLSTVPQNPTGDALSTKLSLL